MPTCAFCGERPASGSGEHVWSAWITRLFGPRAPRRYTLRQFDAHGDVVGRWKAGGLDLRAPVVCGPCNNGWMSELEQHARPILSPMILTEARTELDAVQLVTVAAWAFKTAVVVDHMRTHHAPFFSPVVRRHFVDELTPPTYVQVWLALFRGHRARRGNFTTYYLWPRSRHLKGFKFYVATFVAGHFAFQLLAPRWIKRARRRNPMPLSTHEPAWDAGSVRIWPSNGALMAWPPSHHLNDSSLEEFAYRWARIPL